MSNAWLTWAFEYEGLSHGEKSVLVALADHADEEGFCYPSQERLALYTGLSERSITRNAKALEDRGLISKGKRRHDGGTFQSNTYTLHDAPGQNENHQPEDNLTAGHNVTSPEDINDIHHRTQCPTNPQYKPSIEPPNKKSRYPSHFETFWNEWTANRNHASADSKKQAFAEWNRLTNLQRVQATRQAQPFQRKFKDDYPKASMKHACRYLKHGNFEDMEPPPRHTAPLLDPKSPEYVQEARRQAEKAGNPNAYIAYMDPDSPLYGTLRAPT